MNVIRSDEITFSNSVKIDFQKDRKLFYLVNGLSIPLFALFYLTFHYLLYYTNVVIFRDPFIYFKALQRISVSANIIFLAGLFIILILHELIHGFFFYMFTKDKPVFGFKSLFAYAGAPGWYIKKSKFYIIGLSPLVLITSAGLISCIFLNIQAISVIFLLITVNAAGSLGDIWVSIVLLKKPKETYVNDSGISAVISYN